MKTIDYIKLCDILSPKPSLVANKYDRFQTIYGGLLSLLLIISSMVAFSWFFALLFKKSDFVVISNNSFNTSLNFTFKSEDRLFMFNALTNRGLKIQNQERIFKISAFNMNYTFVKNKSGGIITTFSSTPIKVVPCTKDIVSNYLNYLTEIDYTLYYCLDKNQTIYFQNTPQSTDFYYYLNVYYSPCINTTQNNNSCFDNDTITNTMKIFHNQVVIMDTYFDHNNDSTAEQLYATSTYDPSALAFYSQKYFYFQKYKYVSDDGFALPNYVETVDLSFSDSYYAISQASSSTNVPYAFMVNVFQLHPISTNYSRSYKKIQTVLGEIGGFINALFLIAGIITSYVSTKELHFHIFKKSVIFVDPKKIEKGKFDSLNQKLFRRNPTHHGAQNENINEEEIKIQFETDSNNEKKHKANNIAILRNSNFEHSSNFVLFSVIKRMISEDQLKMNFTDYFMSATFPCYKRENHIREYYNFMEKKVLKLLDISQIINIQNKLKYLIETLFPDEKEAMDILSRVMFYSGSTNKIDKEDFSRLKMNFNENFEKVLKNFEKKLDT